MKPKPFPMTRRDPRAALRVSARDSLDYLESRRTNTTMPGGALGKAIEALEVGAGAAAVGWVAGRFGTVGIGSTDIPAGLVAAGAGVGFAALAPKFLGLPKGAWQNHLTNLSIGGFAGFMALWGAGQGGQSSIKAGNPPRPIMGGAVPAFPPPSPVPAPPAPYAYARPALMPPNLYGQVPLRPSPLSEAELQAMARGMPALRRVA